MIPDQTSKFKNSNGVLLLKEIFFEFALNKDNVLYTLKDRDHEYKGKIIPSLYRLYMEENDPTEYLFATKYLDGWSHWLQLSQASFFKEYISRWREELDLRFRALSLKKISEMAMSDGREAFQASKYLADGNFSSKKSSRGRPTKQQVSETAQRMAEEERLLKEDFARLSETSFPSMVA